MSASPAFMSTLLQRIPPPIDVWLSSAVALRLTDWTDRWLRAQVAQNAVVSRETKAKLPNGRYALEYALSSLPAAAQQRYHAQQSAAAPAVHTTLPLFAATAHGLTLTRKAAPRVQVPASVAPAAENRFALIQPILDMRARGGRPSSPALFLPDGTPVTSEARLIKYLVAYGRLDGKSVSEATIRRMLRRYAEGGAAELVRRQRSDAGSSRYFEQPEHKRAAALVAYLHLGDGTSPGLSAQGCYEMLEAQHRLVGLTRYDLPTDRTVRAFLARITPALRIYATKGRKEFAERMMPYLSRGYQEFSNQIWVSDHAIMDVEVLNDCIPGAPQGVPIRLRLTAILDYRSRVLVGYSWAWEGTSASIATALRFAVMANGPCDDFYIDNGKDFIAIAKGAVPAYLQRSSLEAQDWVEREMRRIYQTGVLARLGIQVTHCLPHHPQSKHIERFFRTMHMTFCKLFPTYTGGKPSERPDQTTALMSHTRRAIRRGEIEKSHHPLASELMQKFAAWLPTYHGKRHGGRGMNHRSPAEVFAAHRNPAQRATPSHEDLVYLLWEHKTVRVRECQVRVAKHDYAPTSFEQSQLMLDRNETTVLVAYDPLDPARVAILDTGGRLVTMLEAKRLVAQAPHDPEVQSQIAAMQQMRGQLTRGLRERRDQIIQTGKQLGVLTSLELLSVSADRPAAPQPGPITPRKPELTATTLTVAPRSPRQVAADLYHQQQQEQA